MSLLKHEFMVQKKYSIIWIIVTSVIVFMMFSEFSAYYKNPEMLALLNQFPEQLLKMFAMDQANLTTLSGFLSVASLYLYILGGTYAILLGNSCLSREERDRTAEFFLSLPISRERILVTKWIATSIQCLIFTLFAFLSILLASIPYDVTSDYINYLFLISFSFFMIQMVFLSLGMLVAAFFKRASKSNAYAVALIILLYFISLLMEVSDALNQYKYITPFKFFDTHEMLNRLSIDPCGIGLTLSISLLLFATTFYLYPKRDLPL